MCINLYVNYYSDPVPQRKSELEFCYTQNKKNSHIDNILLVKPESRTKFSDFLAMINTTSKDDDVNIIANSDIYFNNSIVHALKIHNNHVYALSRWNKTRKGLTRVRAIGSADVWIFKGKKDIYSDFSLGYWGCDGRFGHEIIKAGYQLYNPSLTIKSIHIHTSHIRAGRSSPFQNKTDVVVGPYAGAVACTIDKLIEGKNIISPMPKHYILPKK